MTNASPVRSLADWAVLADRLQADGDAQGDRLARALLGNCAWPALLDAGAHPALVKAFEQAGVPAVHRVVLVDTADWSPVVIALRAVECRAWTALRAAAICAGSPPPKQPPTHFEQATDALSVLESRGIDAAQEALRAAAEALLRRKGVRALSHPYFADHRAALAGPSLWVLRDWQPPPDSRLGTDARRLLSAAVHAALDLTAPWEEAVHALDGRVVRALAGDAGEAGATWIEAVRARDNPPSDNSEGYRLDPRVLVWSHVRDALRANAPWTQAAAPRLVAHLERSARRWAVSTLEQALRDAGTAATAPSRTELISRVFGDRWQPGA
jgi:hypothetical protein